MNGPRTPMPSFYLPDTGQERETDCPSGPLSDMSPDSRTTVRRCTGLRANGSPCRTVAMRDSEDQRCAWHSASPRARRRSTTPRRSSTGTVRGWLVGPARELLDLTPAEMADRLGVTEAAYLSWEADTQLAPQLMPSAKWGRLVRLLQQGGHLAEYVRSVFEPQINAENAAAGAPNLTRSVGLGRAR